MYNCMTDQQLNYICSHNNTANGFTFYATKQYKLDTMHPFYKQHDYHNDYLNYYIVDDEPLSVV